ncbi:tRNA pseudouridine synthase 1 [Saitoella coloradoensis]
MSEDASTVTPAGEATSTSITATTATTATNADENLDFTHLPNNGLTTDDAKKRQPSRSEQRAYGKANNKRANEPERDGNKRVKRELAPGEVAEEKKPKRKVACMIGYCGTGYHGIQFNHPHDTIESALFDAFVKAGAISKDNSDDPKKSSLQRAARTDKGVHAACNLISLKLIIEDPQIVQKINAHLPDQIRLWGIVRTINSFNPRTLCDSRVYEYLIPSYAFLPPAPESAAYKMMMSKEGATIGQDGEAFWKTANHNIAEALAAFEKDVATTTTTTTTTTTMIEEVEAKRSRAGKMEDYRQKLAYRISADRLERIRATFKAYEGNKNYHNYTLGKGFRDPSAKRFIKTFTVSDPKIINDTEWLSLKVHGQSFMLHQIRKMVTMAVLLARYNVPVERIAETFGPVKVNIPKAPSLGLLLERPIFDAYNRKLETGISADAAKPALNFDKYETEIEDFKMKHIYDKIYAEEEKEQTLDRFLQFIDTWDGLDMQWVIDGLSEGSAAATAPARKEVLDEEDKEALQGHGNNAEMEG